MDWQPDILGAPFEQLTLPLGEDDEGAVVATVVRSLPSLAARLFGPLSHVDVLAVHGWSDYFFQTELADFWTSRGARFHALDLRKYGRSMRPGQTPGFVSDLRTYDDDIQAALEAIGHGGDRSAARGERTLVLLGHSTGGLILTLWSSRNRGRARALVLNSPWLELQLGALGRQALAPLVAARARFEPRGSQPVVDLGFYTRAQTQVGVLPRPGYRDDWRPERGFRTHPAWLSAVLEGHRQVAAGIDVGCPVLVLLSARSVPPLAWSDAMTSADSVLVVDDIARAAVGLGALVTIARIDDAIHDVFLSRPVARRQAFDRMDEWVRGVLREAHPAPM